MHVHILDKGITLCGLDPAQLIAEQDLWIDEGNAGDLCEVTCQTCVTINSTRQTRALHPDAKIGVIVSRPEYVALAFAAGANEVEVARD